MYKRIFSWKNKYIYAKRHYLYFYSKRRKIKLSKRVERINKNNFLQNIATFPKKGVGTDSSTTPRKEHSGSLSGYIQFDNSLIWQKKQLQVSVLPLAHVTSARRSRSKMAASAGASAAQSSTRDEAFETFYTEVNSIFNVSITDYSKAASFLFVIRFIQLDLVD